MTIGLTKKSKITEARLLIAAILIATAGSIGYQAPALADTKANANAKANAKTTVKKEKGTMGKIYEFTAKTLDGKDLSLSTYKGDVMLIVNTASECGFTYQYKDLEELNKKYSAKGLKVLGFPCNQFGHQEPGDSSQIATFCTKNYGVDFQMFEKIDVNGKNAHPIYKYLTESAPGALGTEGIKWNFTKFLIDRQGKVIKRYAPNVNPADIAGDIEKLL